MQNPKSSLQQTMRAGFTLPAILVVVGALLLLAVGILLIVGTERNTARSFVDRQRAELAAKAGLEEVRGILSIEAANDEFIVLQSPLANAGAGIQQAPELFLARCKVANGTFSYRYVPLFSYPSTNKVPETQDLTVPDIDNLLGQDPTTYIDYETLPYHDKVRASWIPVMDSSNKMVGRYAYWVEDLQSRIDPAIAGNQKGTNHTHARAAWPFPAAGLNPDPETASEKTLDQIALYAVDSEATIDSQGDIGNVLLKNREMLVSPQSLLAAAEISPPLSRLKVAETKPKIGTIGELADAKSRGVEEGLAAGLQSYKERPMVPYAKGINPDAAGKPKLNLNKLLATGGSAAVNEMASFIDTALSFPNAIPAYKFSDRKGGFPDDYLKTLAANTLDYADTDPNATMGPGYRGIDAYPLVSEFLMRFRWDNVLTEGGRKYVVIKVATYVELWNTTDQPVSGSAEFTHDARYSFQLGANPNVTLRDMSEATPVLTEKDGNFWFPAVNISLKPNEYHMFTCGEITYKIDAGSAAFFVSSPLLMEEEKYGRSQAGYKLRWNGQIVDQSRGGLHRNDCSLKYPIGDRQAVRATIPGHSYSTAPGTFINNMGDARMSNYLSAPQDASAYPINYSPNRRNIRYQIYSGDVADKPKVYGRVLISQWPDGGHNSTCESTAGMTQTNTQLDPDAAVFQLSSGSVLRNPPVAEAPTRLSAITPARFYSATELGRVYDPIMWNVPLPAGANQPWGDVLTYTLADARCGGGNTLRIGRPEHPMFDQPGQPGMEAYHLLDLFHAGLSRSANAVEREAPVIKIEGQVNLNTASRDALRSIAVGHLVMDPKLSKRTSDSHNTSSLMAAPVSALKFTAAEVNVQAERIADAIILSRKTTPFASSAAMAEVRDSSNNPVFGNRNLLPDGNNVEWSDSAAEEIFARVYEASTVRSRNFRIWVVGQAIAPTASATNVPEILSEVRKVYTVFADPGERSGSGEIDPTKTRLTLLNETDF